MSCAYCDECISNKAEPELMFRQTIEDVGEAFVALWVKELSTFKNDKYISWSEWVKQQKAAGAAKL